MRAVGWILAWMLLAPPALVAATLSGASGSGISVQSSSGGGGGPPVANCTDGDNCLCDTINDAYPDVFFCEDFELPTLANTVDSQNGWHSLYTDGGIRGTDDNCLIDDSDPGTYRAGFLGDSEAVAAEQACLAHSYEGNCEVSGETDCVEDGSGGTYSLGNRMQPNRTQGITGRAPWGGSYTTFGVTFLVKWSSNYAVPGGGNGPAHKMNEFGRGDHAILGFSGGSGPLADNPPWVGGIFTETGVGTPSMTTGTASVVNNNRPCGDFSATQFIYFRADESDYEWGTDLNVGEWACMQVHIAGIGTSTATYRAWINEVEVINGTFDLDDMVSCFDGDEAGFDRHAWNNYYNGPSNIDPEGDGYPGSTVGYRWEDNFVITSASEPVPCGAISSSFPAP